jgi:leader peptidase (prepilin peptidase) / N-methyltransferase
MLLFTYYPWLFPGLAAMFGLIIGSFLNVVICRLPKMMEQEWRLDFAEVFPNDAIDIKEPRLTLSSPSSHCPHCHNKIRFYHNVPVISWLWLKGRCADCHQTISVRYPLVEMLTAGMCYLIASHFGPTTYAIALLFFSFTLIAITFIDFDTMYIPDSLSLPLLWAGIILSLLRISPVDLESSIIGAIIGYLSLRSLYHLFKFLTGKEGMGFGDFKLLAALGAWLGWQSLISVILLSSMIGVIFGLLQLYAKKQGLDKPFPFGPYLALAGWISIIWGNDWLGWYISSVTGNAL